MQVSGQTDRFRHATILNIRQIGLHCRDVQLGAPRFGMRVDAPIGDHQYIRSGHPLDIMRADAPAVEFIDAPVTCCNVPYPDDTTTRVKIVFGCEQPGTVCGKRPVTVEMPALGRAKRRLGGPLYTVDHHRNCAGATGERYRLGARGVACGGMAPHRQRNFKNDVQRGADSAQRV